LAVGLRPPGAFGQLAVTGGSAFTRGSSATLQVLLLDAAGKPVNGRQLADVRIADAAGQPHEESRRYGLERGRATVPFRPASAADCTFVPYIGFVYPLPIAKSLGV